MLAEVEKDTFGHLEGPGNDESILMVVAFVEKHLAVFSKEQTGATITNEKGLTQEFCIMLNIHTRKHGCPFIFEKEYMEDVEKGDSAQVDIGVIIIDTKYQSCRKSFFSMEAKRLDKLSKVREKEYLVGREEKGKYKKCGGVERFKEEIHGKGLRYGAMIGYVQKFDFNHWHRTINSWIDALIEGSIPSSVGWSEKDKLLEEYKSTAAAKFKSENSRITGSIILFHLWVNLVK
jgi:hypothetical protein